MPGERASLFGLRPSLPEVQASPVPVSPSRRSHPAPGALRVASRKSAFPETGSGAVSGGRTRSHSTFWPRRWRLRAFAQSDTWWREKHDLLRRGGPFLVFRRVFLLYFFQFRNCPRRIRKPQRTLSNSSLGGKSARRMSLTMFLGHCTGEVPGPTAGAGQGT